MNCQAFDHVLDRLLDGACTPAEWREAEAHVAGCARCRRAFDALAGRGETLGEPDGASLTASVLARTSGGGCDAARDRLCAFVDESLELLDRQLVGDHLAHCQACSALADAVARSTAILPSFAELPVPGTFVRDVLEATSLRDSPSLADRVIELIGRAAARPRFSLELAYACTLVLVLLVGDPVRAFRDVSARGAEYARPTVGRAVEELTTPLAGVRAIHSRTVAAIGVKAGRSTQADTWDGRLSAEIRRLESGARMIAQSAIERVSRWYRASTETLSRLVQLLWPTEPSGPPAR